MIGDQVRYEPYKTFDGEIVFKEGISSQGRDRFLPVYERGYKHYHDRVGLDMPYTRLVLDKSRPEKSGGNLSPDLP